VIGNDIVDISEAKKSKHWHTQRYLDKLFTNSEQVIIKSSENQFEMICRLWSMKESAYKIISRSFNNRFYSPKSLECIIQNNIDGIVSFNEMDYYTKTSSNRHLTHSIATENKSEFNTLVSEILEEKSRPELEEKLLSQFITEDLRIKKKEHNIPVLTDGKDYYFEQFSLTHHGQFSAYAYLK
jgi:phosphopantetheinyl transferase (holo-ACP synthase)